MGRVGAIADGLTVLNMHGHRIAALLVGFDPGRLGGPWKMLRGRASGPPGEFAVDRVLASAHDIKVGGMVHLRGEHLRVVGLTDNTASRMTPLLFVTRSTANRLQRQSDTATFFLVAAAGRRGTRSPPSYGAGSRASP